MKSPETVLERYIDAIQTLNKQAMDNLYARELRMFDMTSPFELRGAGAFAQRVDQWFDDTADMNMNAEASSVESKIVDGMAYMTMFMRYSDTDKDGAQNGMTNRLTWVLVPDGDDWKILHEHTSVPLNEEDMSPQFEP